jgi:hypothetical protein
VLLAVGYCIVLQCLAYVEWVVEMLLVVLLLLFELVLILVLVVLDHVV